jgi:hypothetical protein
LYGRPLIKGKYADDAHYYARLSGKTVDSNLKDPVYGDKINRLTPTGMDPRKYDDIYIESQDEVIEEQDETVEKQTETPVEIVVENSDEEVVEEQNGTPVEPVEEVTKKPDDDVVDDQKESENENDKKNDNTSS